MSAAEKNLKRVHNTQAEQDIRKKNLDECKAASEKIVQETKTEYDNSSDTVMKGQVLFSHLDLSQPKLPTLPKRIRLPPVQVVQPSTSAIPPPTTVTPPAGVIGQPRAQVLVSELLDNRRLVLIVRSLGLPGMNGSMPGPSSFNTMRIKKMEAFEGTWKQIKMDNFDAYLKASGVSLILRKVAGASTPSVEFRNNVNSSKTKDLLQNDGTWTFFFYSTVKNGTWTFKVGEESEEVTPDGRKFMSTITVENGKLYHKQRAIKKGDNDGLITRWVVGDELHTTAEVLLPNGERVTCVAVDKKQ